MSNETKEREGNKKVEEKNVCQDQWRQEAEEEEEASKKSPVWIL